MFRPDHLVLRRDNHRRVWPQRLISAIRITNDPGSLLLGRRLQHWGISPLALLMERHPLPFQLLIELLKVPELRPQQRLHVRRNLPHMVQVVIDPLVQ